MSRRSTRLTSKTINFFENTEDGVTLKEDAEFDQADFSDFDEETGQPARKKRKKTFGIKTKQSQAKRGKLRRLP